MTKILINSKIVEDALNYGYKYVEKNDFKNGIKYLEYAISYHPKDQYSLYALTISYYNIGNLKKVEQLLKEMNEVHIDNQIIKESLEQIKNEIKLRDNNIQKDFTEIVSESLLKSIESLNFVQKSLNLSKEEYENIINNTGDKMFEFLYKPNFIDERFEDFKTYEKAVIKSIINYQNFKEYYYNINKENFNILKFYKFYYNSLKTNKHVIFILLLIKDNISKKLLSDKFSSNFLKNEIVYDILNYYDKGYLTKEQIEEVLLKSQLKINLSEVNQKVYDIEKKLQNTPLYKEVKIYSYVISLIKKYVKTNILNVDNLNIDEITNKILIYVYYSNMSLSDDLKEYIFVNCKANTKKYKEVINEINKINLII